MTILPDPDDDAAASHGHLVVCGNDALALRIVEELTIRYHEQVTVILPSARRGLGPQISALPRVRLVERAEPDHWAFLAAGVRTARAIALVKEDDLTNIHAALRAQEINPDLRIVMASFNAGLGDRIGSFFEDCGVLSESGLAAPSFVAAALDQPETGLAAVADHTVALAQREDVSPASVICGVSPVPGGSPLLSPPADTSSPFVLALASPPAPQPRHRGRRLAVAARTLRAVFSGKLGIAYACALGVLISGFVLLIAGSGYRWNNALYLTVLDMSGAASTGVQLSAWEKIAQFLLTFAGMFVQATITTLLLSIQLPTLRAADRQLRNHVIVSGLGSVGTQVLRQLEERGIEVVCIDKDENADGLPLARRHKVPVVIGEAHREETLLDAGITTCRALISVTSNDTVNLETALLARALARSPRIVLRLYADDLAQQIDLHVGNTISRSVSYLAAPQFAAAMLEHEVLHTIPIDRHVLLLGKVAVQAGSPLDGELISHVHAASDSFALIALQHNGQDTADWSLGSEARIAAGDVVFVLATRAGLGLLRSRSRTRASQQ